MWYDIRPADIGNKRLKNSILKQTKFYFKFGDQKIDIVSFTFEQDDPFKNYILDYAIKLAENKAQHNHSK